MAGKVTERQVVEAWRRVARSGALLESTNGEPLTIVYPGRPNDGRGADFRDAVVLNNGELAKGDIEVHVKSSDWSTHRHHLDATYNRVVLHVVMRHDTGAATCLEDGRCIPVFALDESKPGRAPRAITACSGAGRRLGEAVLAGVLDAAGEERMMEKTAGFGEGLQQVEAGQCLYRGIMGALGYSRNRLPFEELASMVPLDVLESIVCSDAPEQECLAQVQALLAGCAGLLPSQRPAGLRQKGLAEEWGDRLERLWAASGRSARMAASRWSLFKVRPVSFPLRRMAAMSHLLFRFRRSGLLQVTLEAVGRALCGAGSKALEQLFEVAAGGYWADHFDFGMRCRHNPVLLGRGRAAEIVINVVLPFVLALSEHNPHQGRGEGIICLYRGYPRLEANAIERHMKGQLGLHSAVSSACRQQGLIHLYRTLCTRGGCCRCPLSGTVP